MKILILFLIMTIAGCGEITNQEIENAILQCKDNRGLARIIKLSSDSPTIICLNDSRFDLKKGSK